MKTLLLVLAILVSSGPGVANDAGRPGNLPVDPPMIKVNIYGGSFPAATGWNNWNVQSSLSLNNTLYADGTASPVKATLNISNAIADNGTTYPVTMCPVEVGRTTSYSTVARFIILSGLDNSKRYDLEIYASRNNTGNSTRFTVGGVSISVLTDRNYSNKAVFANISPSSGQIRLNIERLNTYNYINGFILKESTGEPVNTLPVSVPGANQVITLPTAQVTLNGSSSYDPDGSITAYQWKRLSGPGTVSIVNPSNASTSVMGFTKGIHVFRLTVTDNRGDTAGNNMQVTVNDVQPPPTGTDSLNCGKAFRIVVLGSSTALGSGATPIDSSWVNKYRKYMRTKHAQSNVINLALSGFTTYHILCPTGFVPPANRPVPDTAHNITKALTYNPDLIIINLPTNDAYRSFPLSEQQANYERTITLASARNIPVWVTTTQPRNGLSASQMNLLTAMRDWTYERFGEKAIDFWTELANPDGTVNPLYNVDGVHVNNDGHHILYTRTVAERLLDTLCLRNSSPPQNIAPIANAGIDQVITLPQNSVSLNGSASSDADGSLTFYQWRQVAGPSSSQLTNANTAIASVQGLVAGAYSFELLVRDNANATDKDTTVVVVNPESGNQARKLQVNIYGGSFPAGAGWNNWNVQSTLSLNNTFYADGTASPVTATMNLSNAVADNGATYPVTMCPMEVGRTTSYSTVARYIVLSGLDNTKTFNLEIYASRNGTGNSTRFTIGTISKTVLTDRNYNNRVVFTGIGPVGGQIRLTIERLNTYNYINGFTLSEEPGIAGSSSLEMQSRFSGKKPAVPGDRSFTSLPNPFSGHIKIEGLNRQRGKVAVSLLSQSGKSLKKVVFVKETDFVSREIRTTDLPAGTYFLKVEAGNKTETFKMVKL